MPRLLSPRQLCEKSKATTKVVAEHNAVLLDCAVCLGMAGSHLSLTPCPQETPVALGAWSGLQVDEERRARGRLPQSGVYRPPSELGWAAASQSVEDWLRRNELLQGEGGWLSWTVSGRPHAGCSAAGALQ